MSEEERSDKTRADALIGRIEADTEGDLDRIRDEARAEAAEVIRAAHGRARRRVHGEIEALRRVRSEALRHEEARLDTARRQLRQREATNVIAAGLPEVATALTELWADKGARTAWAFALVHAATQRLAPGDWTVEHPANWAEAERVLLTTEAVKLTGQAPEFAADPALHAGLRIRAGQACLDASPAALLTDTGEIGAALLAELARAEEIA